MGEPPRRRRRHRRWPWIAGGVAAALVLLMALMPTLLSSAVGRSVVVGVINGRIEGSVQIEALSLSWFGGQRIGGVRLFESRSDEPVTVLETVTTELTLWQALMGNMTLGQTHISGLQMDVIADEDGTTNLQRALASRRPPTDEPVRVPPSLRGTIQLADAHIRVSGAHIDAVQTDLQGHVALAGGGEPIELAIDGRSRQAEVEGDFDVRGMIGGLIAEDGRITPQQIAPRLTATARNLPSDGLDGLLGMRGILAAAIGRDLSITFASDGDRAALDVTLSLASPNLQAQLTGVLRDANALSLREPATLDFIATPLFVERLTAAEDGGPPLSLAQQVTLRVLAERLDVQLDRFGEAAITARLSTDDQIVLIGDERVGELIIANLAAEAHSERLAAAATLSANADLTAAGEPGRFALAADVQDLLDADGRPQWDTMRVDGTVSVANLPVGIADRLGGQGGWLLDALGERLSMDLRAATTGGRGVDMTLAITTPNLAAEQIVLHLDEGIVALRDSAPAQYRLTPAFAARYLPQGQTLAAPAMLDVLLDELILRPPAAGAEDAALFNPRDSVLTVRLAGERLHLSGVPQVEEVFLDNVEGRLQGRPLASFTLALSALAVDVQADGLLAEIGGAERLPVRLDVRSGLGEDRRLSDIAADILIDAPNLRASILARLPAGFGHLRIVDSSITLTATPKLLRRLELVAEDARQLTGPTHVALNVPRAELPLGEDVSLDALELTATAVVRPTAADDPVAVAIGDELTLSIETRPIERAQRPVQLAIDSERIRTRLHGHLVEQDEILAFHLAEAATARVVVTNELLALLGQTAMLDGSADARLNIQRLNVPLRPFTLAAVDVQGSAQVPGLALAANPQIESAALSEVTAELRFTGHAVQAQGQRPQMLNALIQARHIEIVDAHTRTPATLRTLRAAATADEPAAPLVLNITGEVQTAERPGSLDIQAELTGLIDETYALRTEDVSVDLVAKAQQFPTVFIDTLLNQEGLIVLAIGPVAELAAEAHLRQMAGPMDLELISANARAVVRADLSREWLTLREPMTAQFLVTEPLSQRFLKHPLLRQAIRSVDPASLTVQAEGFRIPVRDFDVTQVQIGQATLEPGRLLVRNAGLIRTLTELPEAVARARQLRLDEILAWVQQDELTAWFTPVQLSMADGRLSYSRMDMLLGENYQVATWGTFNLGDQPVQVDGRTLRPRSGRMILGLAERTLRLVYSIPAFEDDPDYVDQFLMAGPLEELSPDKGQMLTRLTALTAAGIAGQIGGEQVSRRVGEFLRIAGQVERAIRPDKRQLEPTPPTPPLPWAQTQPREPDAQPVQP